MANIYKQKFFSCGFCLVCASCVFFSASLAEICSAAVATMQVRGYTPLNAA